MQKDALHNVVLSATVAVPMTMTAMVMRMSVVVVSVVVMRMIVVIIVASGRHGTEALEQRIRLVVVNRRMSMAVAVVFAAVRVTMVTAAVLEHEDADQVHEQTKYGHDE